MAQFRRPFTFRWADRVLIAALETADAFQSIQADPTNEAFEWYALSVIQLRDAVEEYRLAWEKQMKDDERKKNRYRNGQPPYGQMVGFRLPDAR